MPLKITISNENGAELGQLEVDASAETALLHNLPGTDGIVQWIVGAVQGKVSACLGRMGEEAMSLIKSGTIPLASLPDLTPDSLLTALKNHPSYKDRKGRDQEGGEAPPMEAAPPPAEPPKRRRNHP